MSLVSTYVESQEGSWYKNPVIRNKDWFICWDDDEPIELVIALDGPSFNTVIAELNKEGWQVSLLQRGYASWRYFTETISNQEPRNAQSYFLQQMNGPTGKLLAGNESVGKKPKFQGVYYPNAKVIG